LTGYDETRGRQLYLDLLQRLRALPGVQAASLAHVVPFGIYSDGREVRRTGDPTTGQAGKDASGGGQPIYASYNIVGTDYFKTLGLPLLRGREFDRLEASATSAAKVAIIDQPLAEQLFPGEEALGRQVRFSDKSESLQIVGVVRGVKNELNEKTLQPHIYVPFGQEYRSGMNVQLRVASPAGPAQAALLKTVRETIRAQDPQLAVLSVQTYRRFHEEGILLWFAKMASRLFTLFGLLALFLAAVGIYGVKAYVVSRRTREIGIRMALGASARHVLWMVLRDGLRLTSLGLGVGLLLALAVGFGLRSFVYGVSAIDPFAFTVAPLSLALAALIACYLPARRATRIQPMAALRYE
ncbi:MAG TPA: ABC transporter permease, partial [Candidatus Sulfotelmatobacter sp.]|nr:ABC transporter permease [Candidatus Sulfotelmatobacter sp.]